jgi:hypothetical protein
MTLALDQWMTIWRPGPALLDENTNSADYGCPLPGLYDEIPGTRYSWSVATITPLAATPEKCQRIIGAGTPGCLLTSGPLIQF